MQTKTIGPYTAIWQNGEPTVRFGRLSSLATMNAAQLSEAVERARHRLELLVHLQQELG